MEEPGSRPLAFEASLGPDCGGLGEWPLEHVVKALCFCHPDDDDAMWSAQIAAVRRLFAAARRNRLELLLEAIPSKVGPVDDRTTAAVMERFYDAGVFPDWWKLEAQPSDAGWRAVSDVLAARDPHCRGVLVLGLDAPEDALRNALAGAARHPVVKGFAVGRTIFGDAARRWFAGAIEDGEAVDMMAQRFSRLVDAWDAARTEGKAKQ